MLCTRNQENRLAKIKVLITTAHQRSVTQSRYTLIYIFQFIIL